MAKKKRTKKGQGRYVRRRGHDFERWVAQKLRSVFPDSKRHLEYQVGEANGIDIDNTGEFKIQCKRGKNYSPITAIEEVQLDPLDGGIPVLVTKGDNKPAMVCLPFDDFLRMIK